MKSDGWVPARDIRNYADGQLTVTAPRSTGEGETMPTAIEAHRTLCLTRGVTDYRTARGGCRGCGECCSRFLPMSRMDERRLAGYVARHGIALRPEPEGALDLTCPLLSEEHECMAYDARPDICRVYRCDEHLRGELRPPAFADHMRLVDVRELLEGGGDDAIGD